MKFDVVQQSLTVSDSELVCPFLLPIGFSRLIFEFLLHKKRPLTAQLWKGQ